jgi:ectoine hydroxylase-related dioxygenase (phytanoyl-CoA dioxygenase family)
MENQELEIEALQKQIEQLKQQPPADATTLRLRERDEEFKHRILELELASEGMEPIGISPQAKAHGGKAFTTLMKQADIDELLPIIKKVHREGFAIVPGFLTKTQLQTLRSEMDPFFQQTAKLFEKSNISRHEGKQTVHIQNLLAKTSCVDPVAANPQLRAIMSGLLGHDFILNAGAVAMAPDPGCSPQGLHRDDGFYAWIPRPHMPLVITVAIALDDFTTENGATGLIPKSCLWDEARSPQDTEIEQQEMSAGSMLIWDGATFHRGGGNQSKTPRRTLTLNYTRGWLRTQFNQYLSVPRKRIEEMPDVLRADLGYHRSALGLGGCDYQDPMNYLTRLNQHGGDDNQNVLGQENEQP